MITSIGWAGSRSKYIVHFPYLSRSTTSRARRRRSGVGRSASTSTARRAAPDRAPLVHREALFCDAELEANLVGELVGIATPQEPSELFDVELRKDGRWHRLSG
jgi:hypothetical protein